MMMPFQVTMLSQYLVLNRLGMLDRPQSVVLPGIFATFSVFIMYRFFRGIPENVMEAARMDGAGEFQIFLRIVGLYGAASRAASHGLRLLLH